LAARPGHHCHTTTSTATKPPVTTTLSPKYISLAKCTPKTVKRWCKVEFLREGEEKTSPPFTTHLRDITIPDSAFTPEEYTSLSDLVNLNPLAVIGEKGVAHGSLTAQATRAAICGCVAGVVVIFSFNLLPATPLPAMPSPGTPPYPTSAATNDFITSSAAHSSLAANPPGNTRLQRSPCAKVVPIL
jgi:hypothetical protein